MFVASQTCRICVHGAQPRRVEDVGAGALVGLQARDRVVEVVDTPDVVLGAAAEHERKRQPARRFGRGGNALGGVRPLVDPPVAGS